MVAIFVNYTKKTNLTDNYHMTSRLWNIYNLNTKIITKGFTKKKKLSVYVSSTSYEITMA